MSNAPTPKDTNLIRATFGRPAYGLLSWTLALGVFMGATAPLLKSAALAAPSIAGPTGVSADVVTAAMPTQAMPMPVTPTLAAKGSAIKFPTLGRS